jgi:hypothetical protein
MVLDTRKETGHTRLVEHNFGYDGTGLVFS